jgi:hypothetical protein
MFGLLPSALLGAARRALIIAGLAAVVIVALSLRPGASVAGATEVQLDTYRANNSHPIVATGPVLQSGQPYTITIVGSFSYWFAVDWQTYGACNGSTPENMPVFPSPGTTNGKVGDDAAWHFAGPKGGLSDCSGPFPVAGSSLGISLNGGSTTSDLVVDDPGTAPDPSHTYHYSVVGQGKTVVFNFDDSKTVDNYGILKFTIEPTPLTWGDNNCLGGITALDALPTLLHKSGLDPQGTSCPAIGQTLHTASFGDRIWGDLDCSGYFDAPDVLLILRYVAGLPPANLQDCPALGIEIALQPG